MQRGSSLIIHPRIITSRSVSLSASLLLLSWLLFSRSCTITINLPDLLSLREGNIIGIIIIIIIITKLKGGILDTSHLVAEVRGIQIRALLLLPLTMLRLKINRRMDSKGGQMDLLPFGKPFYALALFADIEWRLIPFQIIQFHVYSIECNSVFSFH